MNRRRLYGVAAAACVACCVGAFLAAVGGIAALGVVGTFVFGVAALVLAGVVIAVIATFRHHARR